MQVKIIFRLTLMPVGIALLLAALFFDMGTAISSDLQVVTTSTPDRLAEPTLPASPSQADQGAQVYWLSCLPCHGDRGQGLTEEFRQVYPPEDSNCWESGCHGNSPYENGFTLPTTIPALVGPGSLQKFPTAANLRGYIFATMPFWKPGSLTEEQTLQVTAFLLRQNNLQYAPQEITLSNAGQIPVGPPQATPTPQPVPASGTKFYVPFLIGLVVLILLVVIQRLFRKK